MAARVGRVSRRRSVVTAALLVVLAGLAGACTSGGSASRSSAPAPKTGLTTAATAAPSGGGATALAVLARVPVKGRSSRTAYRRARFGKAWADVDRNGCDTRNDILNRDLTAKTWRPGTHGCVVTSGTLADPYRGASLPFSKAQATAVQIDHVVALGDAWQTGASAWDDARRVQFANDPLELLAVDGPLNEAKGDADAASWLPPNRSFRCAYVARQIAVKAKWGLWVTPAEHDAMAAVLARCPAQPLPV